MRGVQCGRLGKEWYFLMVPVDEDMTRRRENVRGAALQESNDFFLSFEGEKGRDGL